MENIKNVNDIEPSDFNKYSKYKKLSELRAMDEKELLILNNLNQFRLLKTQNISKNIFIFFLVVAVLSILLQIVVAFIIWFKKTCGNNVYNLLLVLACLRKSSRTFYSVCTCEIYCFTAQQTIYQPLYCIKPNHN